MCVNCHSGRSMHTRGRTFTRGGIAKRGGSYINQSATLCAAIVARGRRACPLHRLIMMRLRRMCAQHQEQRVLGNIEKKRAVNIRTMINYMNLSRRGDTEKDSGAGEASAYFKRLLSIVLTAHTTQQHTWNIDFNL